MSEVDGDDIPAELLGLAGMVQLPTQDRLAMIYGHAVELAALEVKIGQVEAELQRLKDDRQDLSGKKLPKLFDDVQTDHVGVPGYNADLVLKTRIHANVSSEWEEAEQEAGFAEIERCGGADMIKVGVTVQFGRNEFQQAADLVRHLQGLNWLGGRTVTIRKGVHWGTLTKWLTERIEKRRPTDLAKIGGSITRTCNIVWRKTR